MLPFYLVMIEVSNHLHRMKQPEVWEKALFHQSKDQTLFSNLLLLTFFIAHISEWNPTLRWGRTWDKKSKLFSHEGKHTMFFPLCIMSPLCRQSITICHVKSDFWILLKDFSIAIWGKYISSVYYMMFLRDI